MNLEIHELLSGEEVRLQGEDPEGGRLVQWLSDEALQARSWIEFQQRTAHAIIQHAKERSHDDWQSDDLYKLQLDFIGQIGIATNELGGENTPTFGSLLLGAAISSEHSSRAGLLTFLIQAARKNRAVEEEKLHMTVFDLRLRKITPFGYVFDIKPPNLIFSSDLADDYEAIENARLVQAASPIHATQEGQDEVGRIGRKYISLLPAVDVLVQTIRTLSVEELFTEGSAKAFEAAL